MKQKTMTGNGGNGGEEEVEEDGRPLSEEDDHTETK